MVSSSDSPLLADDAEIFRFMISADKRVEAISKVVRVRVLFSKNKLNTLLPRISGTFLTSLSLTLTNEAAVSRIRVMIDAGRPSRVSKCCNSPCLLSCGLYMIYRQAKAPLIIFVEYQLLLLAERDGVRNKIGSHR